VEETADFKKYRRKNQKKIRKKLRENLKINTLEGKLTNKRIRWYGHILRMGKERILRRS
jgi:hypothetical protein